ARLAWGNLTKAETEYSKRRRQSVFDEWKASYFGLAALFPLIARLGPRFTLADISDTDITSILSLPRVEDCSWLRSIQEAYCTDRMKPEQIKIEIVRCLFQIGIIGIKQAGTPHIQYSVDQAFDSTPEFLLNSTFVVHKMFWSAF